jgi:hypothetical protein
MVTFFSNSRRNIRVLSSSGIPLIFVQPLGNPNSSSISSNGLPASVML